MNNTWKQAALLIFTTLLSSWIYAADSLGKVYAVTVLWEDGEYSIDNVGQGTIFSLKVNDKKYWVGAGHVVNFSGEVKNRTYIIATHAEVDVDFLPHYLSDMKIHGYLLPWESIHNDTILPYYNAYIGSDYFYIGHQDLVSISSIPSDLPLSKSAFVLRDLVNNPLAIGDRVTIQGIQGKRVTKVKCRFLGYDVSLLFEWDKFDMVFDCENTPSSKDNRSLYLAGVSGGPMLDSKGDVIGVFSGAYGATGKPHQWFLRGSPLFYGDNSLLYSLPGLRKNNSQITELDCFEFVVNQKFIGEDIIDYPQKYLGKCAFHFENTDVLQIEYTAPSL